MQAGDTEANGIANPANAIALNGGTLADAGGTAATLTHALVAASGSLNTDTLRAWISSVCTTEPTTAQNSTVNLGDVVTATVTMSENTTVTGTPLVTLTVGSTDRKSVV